ncbi:MAG: DUF2238 domain-containing protein [Burkholderiales bacterium]|nr:MAG: DUF2238 domain-containing protein [Burkholderiales bacterium]
MFAAALFASRPALPLSRVSYTTIFAFLLVHSIGAYYTYSLVPWQDWLNLPNAETAQAPVAGRNHFDPLAHFAYGLLLAYPTHGVLQRVAELRGF